MLGADLQTILMRIPALLIAITFHEFAHARMAYHFGDSTAKSYGRMTLNPISHLDPIGTIMILLVGFGWAKPVPINPNNFNRYRAGLRWVSFAGPLSNLILGFLSLLIFILLLDRGWIAFGGLLFMFFQVLVSLNIMLAIFNMLPVPPLDGSKILMSFLPTRLLGLYRQLEQWAPILLIALIFLPVPGPYRSVLHAIIVPVSNAIFSFYLTLIGYLPGF